MNKKIKYKYFIIIFMIILIIISKLQLINKNQEDIIFFRLFNQNCNNKNNNEVIFKLTNDKIQVRKVNLIATLNNNGLMRGKIAPGTKGQFIIKVKSNKEIKYKIHFKGENEKPKNLVFNIENTIYYYEGLEELNEKLYGKLKREEQKSIVINWKWNYYQDDKGDLQDTKDGIRLKQYIFKIYIFPN